MWGSVAAVFSDGDFGPSFKNPQAPANYNALLAEGRANYLHQFLQSVAR